MYLCYNYSYTELEILRRVDYDQIDWMKIAKIDLDSQWSSSECRLVWENVCSIEINQAKWTHVELKRLVELAKKYNEKDWAKICAELDNGRSAYLCMKRYHEKTVDKVGFIYLIARKKERTIAC